MSRAKKQPEPPFRDSFRCDRCELWIAGSALFTHSKSDCLELRIADIETFIKYLRDKLRTEKVKAA